MKNRLILSFCFMALYSCSGVDTSGGTPEETRSEVVLPIGGGVSSRTQLQDPDDLTNMNVEWSVNDEVALWAVDSSTDAEVLTAEKFTLKYYTSTYDVAEFSADIDELDSDKEYYYRAVYPYPDVVDSSAGEVSWTLPASQGGEYSGAYDLRVAEPVLGAPLSYSYTSESNLLFRSIVHVLRITIPEGLNGLDEDINRLVVNFPFDAVGDIVVSSGDLTTTTSELRNGSSEVVLDFDDPINVGDYVYLFMAPQPTEVSGEITIMARGVDGNLSDTSTIDIGTRSFAAGYLTPVGATIEPPIPLTTLDFTVNYTQLGEPVDNVTITAPEGAVFVETNSNTATLPVVDNTVSLSYDAAAYGAYIGTGKSLTVVYDSENTDIEVSYTLPTLTVDEVNSVTLTAPYLFEETFSGISSFTINDDSGTGTSSSYSQSNYTPTSDLSSYGLSGWTSARASGSAGVAIRIVCYEYRSQNFWGTTSGGTYNGRMDSAKIGGNLKSGKTPKVTVTFSYSGAKAESGDNSGTPTFDYGWFNESSATAVTYNASNSTLTNGLSTWLNQGTSGSYSSTGSSESYTISACSAWTRLSWSVSCTKSSPSWLETQYGNYWLYIDNVRVSISQ